MLFRSWGLGFGDPFKYSWVAGGLTPATPLFHNYPWVAGPYAAPSPLSLVLMGCRGHKTLPPFLSGSELRGRETLRTLCPCLSKTAGLQGGAGQCSKKRPIPPVSVWGLGQLARPP